MKTLITFENVIKWLEIHNELGNKEEWKEILRLAKLGFKKAKKR